MKVNKKSILITGGLLLIMFIVLLVEVSLFISGPTRKYEDKIVEQENIIMRNYKDVKKLERHVFNYIIYVGEDSEEVIWFNEEGAAITTRKKDTLREKEVSVAVMKNYGVKQANVKLGYGYDNPVYVVHTEKGEILIDYDKLGEVYYIKKGDA